jgi:hypothetical protein
MSEFLSFKKNSTSSANHTEPVKAEKKILLTETPKKPAAKMDIGAWFKKMFKKKKATSVSAKPAKPKKINAFSNPEILEVDLIKDEVEVGFNWRKNLWIMAGLVFLVVIVAGEIYGTLYLWEKNEIYLKADKLRSETKIIDKEISEAKAKATEATAFKDELNFLSPIFNGHIYWTNFFKYLEKNTLADVSYASFKGDTSGNYALHAFVKDFRAIGVQLKSFLSDPETTTATIANEKINNTDKVGVSFDLNLSIKRTLFNE